MRYLSITYALPSNVITNADVCERLIEGSSPHLSGAEMSELLSLTQTAFATAGTTVRYHIGNGEKPSDLCVRAGLAALEEAQIKPSDVDLLLYVGIGRGFLEPATANVFQDLLGLSRATCFDVLDACASWLRAVEIARSLMSSGGYRTAMIINGEFIGRYAYRYALRTVSEFFHWFPGVTVGEAATATVITSGGEEDNFHIDFRNYGDKRGLCIIPLANYRDYLGEDPPNGMDLVPLQFSSYGTRLLRFGAKKLVDHYKSAPCFNSQPYDIVFGHAASDQICESIGVRCGLSFDKFKFTHQLFGNTASASLPLALATAKAEGRLFPGTQALVLYASAGVSTALARFTYRE
jgi:3-oxoacyl-[acyl-carrier-protein] synthase III